MRTEDQFLVIGAGPLGLGMAKALDEHGVPYVQVEATDHVGGNWAHGVYRTAHIISSRRTTEYPDHPMPAHYPAFPSARQMCAYYNDFADTHGLRPRIHFERRLEDCVPVDGLWACTFADGTSQRFKGVFVCNGHHWKRSYPGWVEEFSGEVLHSKDYQRPEDIRDRQVLVLGGGNSGCDLVSEAARVSARADWSLRRGC
ncbi:MAG: NAD(P)/FAD-dependent oxidoreductase, partial [Myxococcota bacterium]|nr:NAD(P)/FAD-dependent oxidoreductase [Myxococcota bacterium]